MTAQWAHFDENGPEQLIEGYHHSRQRAFLAVTDYLNTPQDEIDAALQSMTTKGKQLLCVTDRIKQIDYNATFKTEYMRQSQIIHVTGETVTAFLHLDDQKQFVILSEAIDPYESKTAHFTAMATMFASWVLESLRLNTPGLAELDQLSDELALPLHVRD